MIQRALKLRTGIDAFTRNFLDGRLNHLSLCSTEWQQLEYLSDILAPYYKITLSLSEQQGPSIHQVFGIYETLFDHLEHTENLLEHKRVDWKVKLCSGVYQAHKKL